VRGAAADRDAPINAAIKSERCMRISELLPSVASEDYWRPRPPMPGKLSF
jgi:hypothetical protein